MGLFTTSLPNTRGVFAVENPPPSIVVAEGTNTAVCLGQFPWGPSNVLNYPDSPADFYNTYAPRGMNRTGSAHLSIIRKGWPVLGAVRVKDPTAVAATAVINKTGPTALLNVVANSTGTQGNSIILTIGAAGDGNSAHFSFAAAVSGASGTTQEFYDNCNVSGTGANVLPVLTNSLLLASVTAASTGSPIAGNTTMSGGTDGTTTSTQYVGTPGGGDYGLALLENDLTINHVFTDDCGSSLRAAVNNGMVAHGELMTDRVMFINGNSGQTAAQAQTDVANYRSTRAVYVDPWVYIYDDTDGTMRLAPGSCWGASLAAQLPPSAAISWRSPLVGAMLAGVAQLEADRGTSRGQNTASGIATLIKKRTGGFTFEAGVNTSAVAGQTELTRTRMGQYIARSIVDAWEPYVDAPSVAIYQQDMINGAQQFLGTLKKNQGLNPAFFPYIKDFRILDPSAGNTEASLDLGDYTVPVDIQVGSNMHRIFLSMRYGENVTVQAA